MAELFLTDKEKEIKKLRKRLRQSQAAIPGALIFGALCLAALLAVDWFVTVAWWVYAAILWVVPFGLVGDSLNIWYIKRKLARLHDERRTSSQP